MNEYLLALAVFLKPQKISPVPIVIAKVEVVEQLPIVPVKQKQPDFPLTPIPPVESTPAITHHRSDGYDNMCYRLDNGYTTVIISNYEGNDRIFPYLGEIDPSTNTPATAEGSQKWCEANDPIETGNAS